jgi:isopenicillin-N epimerase
MPQPRFGHSMLAEWTLDPQVLYLNHGTVGATPRRVLAAQQRLRDEMERRPSQFLLRETVPMVGGPPRQPSLLREAAARVGRFLGCDGADLAFVDNATTGANAVLQSVDLRAGDEILVTDHGYGGVTQAVRHAARRAGAIVRTVMLPYPRFDEADAVRRVREALTSRTRLAVLDHVTSESAILLPIAELAATCRRAGVAVLADGAHVPGAIPLDIPSLGVDWYAANLHKWAWAPRSSGVLWAAPQRQEGLHPPVISWGLDQGFAREFDWVGTRDPTPWLAAPAALDFMGELGVGAVQGWNHTLAWEAGQWLCRRWSTELGVREAQTGTMITVPLPASLGSTRDDAARLRDVLLYEDGIEVQLHAFGDALYTRISAQVYNEIADVERLGEAVLRRA